jgi:hypothetical protein
MPDSPTTNGPHDRAHDDAEHQHGAHAHPNVLIRIVAPHFVAGIEARDGRVIRAAPILAYMLGWDGARVAQYAKRRGWTWQRL